MTGESNVRTLLGKGESAEDMLRASLAECAEMRSRGKEPQVLVLVLEDEHPPGVFRTPMFINDLAACSALVQALTNRAWLEWVEDRGGA